MSEQIIDQKVQKALAFLETQREVAKKKREEQKAMGTYKTNGLLNIYNRGTKKLQTLSLDQLVEAAEFIMERQGVSNKACDFLGLTKSNEYEAKLEGYTHSQWLHDIKICVLKRQADELEAKVSETEQRALALESETNRRGRAADALLKELGIF